MQSANYKTANVVGMFFRDRNNKKPATVAVAGRKARRLRPGPDEECQATFLALLADDEALTAFTVAVVAAETFASAISATCLAALLMLS